jgi:LmbE family N-acetylglucosaminyl deacetylase
MKYCFDIDDTICKGGVPYEQAYPYPKVVKRINELYDEGHYIVISTARGKWSGENWFEFTEGQLKEWGVKYHELEVGKKPGVDIFVDDRAVPKMKHIMAIGAHPDDIEFGCGGTLLKHKLRGDKVIYVCMTDTQSVDKTTGKVIRSHEQLKKETQCAADELGVNEIHYLPFTDLNVPFNLESVSELERLIKKYEIDTIYTHWAGDSNQDHIATFRTTMAAARYIPNVYCYEQIPIPRQSENPMNINYFVDIDTTFEQKIKAAECHQSQYTKYSKAGFDVSKNLKTMALYRGIQANCTYAEGFHIIKKVENDYPR